jgi:hypothetical protein
VRLVGWSSSTLGEDCPDAETNSIHSGRGVNGPKVIISFSILKLSSSARKLNVFRILTGPEFLLRDEGNSTSHHLGEKEFQVQLSSQPDVHNSEGNIEANPAVRELPVHAADNGEGRKVPGGMFAALRTADVGTGTGYISTCDALKNSMLGLALACLI